MNRLLVRDMSLVAVVIAAITTVALGLSSRASAPGSTVRPGPAGPADPAWTCAYNPVRHGAKLFVQKSCASCHSVDGSARIGPTFLHDFGSTVTLDNGTTVSMDAAYIRESVMSPRAKARPGYPASMPSFDGIVNERELAALTAYLESLR